MRNGYCIGTHINEVAMQLVGIDLAWRSDANPTALAVGNLKGTELIVADMVTGLLGTHSIVNHLASLPDLNGVAVDGPLIIENVIGQRRCEALVGKKYGARKASCHTSNLTLFHDANSVQLSHAIAADGFQHLGLPSGKWQIECYPHPALIEIFGLNERHPYKKGYVNQRRNGQCELARLIRRLTHSEVLSLKIPLSFSKYLEENHIQNLSGLALKHNEDVLDALICLYICGLYAIGIHHEVYGNTAEGYIYVPQIQCI